jgi:hypothetical protein
MARPGVGGCGREVGQLVVQQEAAARHVEGAEGRFHRGRHHHHVALPVDDGDVRGAVLGAGGGLPSGTGPRLPGCAVPMLRVVLISWRGRAGRPCRAWPQSCRRAAARSRCRPRSGRGRHRPGAAPRHQVHAQHAGPAAVHVDAWAERARSKFSRMPSACATARPPDDGGGPCRTPAGAVVDAHRVALLRTVGRQVGQRGHARGDVARGVARSRRRCPARWRRCRSC